ncbi:hypothetical protein JYU34_021024 [Plutella xylostella]|uniref:beta-N-acetylhexosaminidase n=1 Tax=Plutella xylostella TaxID=51655 RepID=A0ABQ7PSJ1_PLUXY|nr:hypothetical protein JYU34_021024 [Plutella xylostella]
MAGRWSALVLALAAGVVNSMDTSFNTTQDNLNFEPQWTYKCVPDEGCQRMEPMGQTSRQLNASLFQNVDVCHAVCGRFGSLWPRPGTAALSTQLLKIHPNYLRYDIQEVPAEARHIIASMTHVTSQNLLAECDGNVTELAERPLVVYIHVKSADLTLDEQTNEQYMLDVVSRSANNISVYIVADTVYGARHALESFTQLIAPTRAEFSGEKQCGLFMVAGAKIRDKPVFKHRGLLLDTSRNFLPMADIKRTVDGMAATKMNVLHWHVTDSHSFPLESTRVPQFTRFGAYSPAEIYTVEEVQDLIQYARVRGVRVMIEIDAPAHAGNGWQWGKEYGYGDLAVCVNSKEWRKHCIQPPCGQLNPANPEMYNALRHLYRDIAELMTKPALFHMGGDEVFFSCWNSSQEIVSYMKDKGYSTDREGFIKLWAEFHSKALQIWDEEYAAAGGKAPQPVMLWSSELTKPERIDKYLDKTRYIIEVWEPLDSPVLKQLIRLGYRTISVPKDIWYLDHGLWGITKYSNWRRMYSHTLPADPKALGGEVAMWSEYIDANGLDARVWPRAAAVGERLWADPTSPASAAEPRLQRLRRRLMARGLRPDVLAPGWCADHETKCL